LVGGGLGSETMATTAFQSLRIPPARLRTFFSILRRLRWQSHPDAGHRPLDGLRVLLGVADPLDEALQVAHEVATEAGAGAVIVLGERRPSRTRWARQRCRRG
jgi:hypothetical protein